MDWVWESMEKSASAPDLIFQIFTHFHCDCFTPARKPRCNYFKITIGWTVFNFPCKTSVWARLGALFPRPRCRRPIRLWHASAVSLVFLIFTACAGGSMWISAMPPRSKHSGLLPLHFSDLYWIIREHR